MTRAALALALVASSAFAAPAESYPAPKPGHFAADFTGTVGAATLAELDRLGQQVDASGEGQLGIAVVPTVDGASPRAYATRLFNRWGVGHAGRNDGVLLFVAVNDRKAEIVLGDGVRALGPSGTDRVMQQDLLPNFKRGQSDQGLLAAAASLSQLLLHRSGGAAANLAPTPQAVREVLQGRLAAVLRGERPLEDPAPRHWLLDGTEGLEPTEASAIDRAGDAVWGQGAGHFYVLVTEVDPQAQDVGRAAGERLFDKLLVLHPGSLFLLHLDRRNGLFQVHGAPRSRVLALTPALRELEARAGFQLGPAAQAVARLLVDGPPPVPLEERLRAHLEAIFAAGVALVLGLLVAVRRWWRYRARHCAHCGNTRELLSETADDWHLDDGQQKEEALGSVDYDVWWCGRCRDALVVQHSKLLSMYGKCRKCGYRTQTRDSHTLEHATEWSTGRVEVVETCAACNHQHRTVRYTSRLSSTDSSSSSSSSSDSSFGGGSSSGSGSSGSW